MSLSHRMVQVPITTLSSGQSIEVVFHVLDSGIAGPRLGLVAAIHGDETVAVLSIREMFSRLEALDWRGSIVALPIANPLAFEAQSRSTPLDMLNLNRVFPGNSKGSVTEQMASAIGEYLLEHVDVAIDFHGADGISVNDYCYMPPGEGSPFTDARALAMAFGQKWLYEAELPPGSLANQLNSAGIPTIVPEFGGGSYEHNRYVELGIDGILRAMQHLAMLEVAVERVTGQVRFRGRATIRSSRGGLYVPQYDPSHLGHIVDAETHLATILHPLTLETIEIVRQPFRRAVILLARHPSRIHPGDYCYIVADLEDPRTQPLKSLADVTVA